MHQVCPCLLVGLGNPGTKYERSRHNIGFMIADRIISEMSSTPPTPDHYADSYVWQFRVSGRDLILQKPLSFMNSSGNTVEKLSRARNILPEQILVIHDDLDLPLGKIRLRQGGGSGGHLGVESIRSSLETDRFNRLRVGIGKDRGNKFQTDYVLSPFTDDERPALEHMIGVAAEAALLAVRRGIEIAMNKYNGMSAAEDNNNE
jgi:peptidyl-tRNA hydrolase, PTH1 family